MKNIDLLAKKHLKQEVYQLLQSNGLVKPTRLLSGNTKLDKGKDIVLGLAMLPADSLNNYLAVDKVKTVCPTAKNHGCEKVCIGLYSGHYSMLKGSAHKAQIKRALSFHFDKESFCEILENEIKEVAQKAIKGKQKLFIRLDVFSDNKAFNSAFIKSFFDNNPSLLGVVSFYDYTKIHKSIKHKSMDYARNIALSVSKNCLTGKLFSEYKKALPLHNYSAIVVPEDQVEETINKINTLSKDIHAVNGDLFDNFTEHRKDYEGHIVLVLKGKGAKKDTKQKVVDLFALSCYEALSLYSAAFCKHIL